MNKSFMIKSPVYEWEIPSTPVILQRNEAHIWHVDIEKTVHDLEFYRKLLSFEEEEQADRFHFERDRIRHIITHGVLRLLISKYLGIEPNKIIYTYNKYRKPEVANSSDKKLCLNLSHSGNFIIYTFSWDRQLGIDIERVREMEDADGIIERFCSDHEKAEYFSFAPENRTEIFFKCWTRKEAYIKARGDGLYFPLDHFSVSLNPNEPPILIDVKDEPLEKDRWHFHEIVVDDDYYGTFAIEDDKVILRLFKWVK